jgi:MoxR-like ATPase
MAKKAVGGSVSVDPSALTSRDFTPWFGDPTVIKRILVAFKLVGNVRLIGETGSGKTTIVYTLDDLANGGAYAGSTKSFYADRKHNVKALDDAFWKKYLGQPWHLYTYSLTQDTSRWDLVATQTLRGGTVDITPGPIQKWLEDTTPGVTKVLLLDEYNYASAGVTSLLNELADFRKTITVSELAIADQSAVESGKSDMDRALWGKRERTSDHLLITTENPYDVTSYAGTNPPNIAQQNRFIPVEVPYMSFNDEIQMCLKAVGGDASLRGQVNDIVTLATQIRQKYREHQLSMVLSPRNTQQLSRILGETRDFQIILDTMVDWFPAQDKNEIRGLSPKAKV